MALSFLRQHTGCTIIWFHSGVSWSWLHGSLEHSNFDGISYCWFSVCPLQHNIKFFVERWGVHKIGILRKVTKLSQSYVANSLLLWTGHTWNAFQTVLVTSTILLLCTLFQSVFIFISSSTLPDVKLKIIDHFKSKLLDISELHPLPVHYCFVDISKNEWKNLINVADIFLFNHLMKFIYTE